MGIQETTTTAKPTAVLDLTTPVPSSSLGAPPATRPSHIPGRSRSPKPCRSRSPKRSRSRSRTRSPSPNPTEVTIVTGGYHQLRTEIHARLEELGDQAMMDRQTIRAYKEDVAARSDREAELYRKNAKQRKKLNKAKETRNNLRLTITNQDSMIGELSAEIQTLNSTIASLRTEIREVTEAGADGQWPEENADGQWPEENADGQWPEENADDQWPEENADGDYSGDDLQRWASEGWRKTEAELQEASLKNAELLEHNKALVEQCVGCMRELKRQRTEAQQTEPAPKPVVTGENPDQLELLKQYTMAFLMNMTRFDLDMEEDEFVKAFKTFAGFITWNNPNALTILQTELAVTQNVEQIMRHAYMMQRLACHLVNDTRDDKPLTSIWNNLRQAAMQVDNLGEASSRSAVAGSVGGEIPAQPTTNQTGGAPPVVAQASQPPLTKEHVGTQFDKLIALYDRVYAAGKTQGINDFKAKMLDFYGDTGKDKIAALNENGQGWRYLFKQKNKRLDFLNAVATARDVNKEEEWQRLQSLIDYMNGLATVYESTQQQ